MKKEDEKIKNILDLKYQRLLSYLNIFVISIITIFIAYVIPSWEDLVLGKLITLLIIFSIIIIMVILIFEVELDNIKNQIINL